MKQMIFSVTTEKNSCFSTKKGKLFYLWMKEEDFI